MKRASRFLTVLIATVMLGGCSASRPTPIAEARPAPASRTLAFQASTTPAATIVGTRDTGFGGSGCFYALWINTTLAARLDTGETSRFTVPPGEVLLRAGRDPQGRGLCSVDTNGATQRETILHPGETKFFRLSIGTSGKPDIERAD